MTGRDGILTSSVFLLCLFVPSEKWGTPGKLQNLNGGDDGTRTRGLCRDRAAF